MYFRENEQEDDHEQTMLAFTKVANNISDAAHSCDTSLEGGAHCVVNQHPATHKAQCARSSSGRSRHSYFRARKLQRVCTPM